mmetsp:Transcript_15416/g.64004  ORF Transcript_15416/g.64004 Transcript_15416/m.64004 type:complete len:287 (-) Transcript_15416:111-971(-)
MALLESNASFVKVPLLVLSLPPPLLLPPPSLSARPAPPPLSVGPPSLPGSSAPPSWVLPFSKSAFSLPLRLARSTSAALRVAAPRSGSTARVRPSSASALPLSTDSLAPAALSPPSSWSSSYRALVRSEDATDAASGELSSEFANPACACTGASAAVSLATSVSSASSFAQELSRARVRRAAAVAPRPRSTPRPDLAEGSMVCRDPTRPRPSGRPVTAGASSRWTSSPHISSESPSDADASDSPGASLPMTSPRGGGAASARDDSLSDSSDKGTAATCILAAELRV